MALTFPNIDPVIFSVGPVAVRWYSMAYLAGFVGAWGLCRAHIRRSKLPLPTLPQMDDFIFWVVLGVIMGGRIGYVLFYNFAYYLQNPTHIGKLWEGGMSFHGGLIGVAIAVITYAYKKKIPILRLGDLAACGATVGLFFGRLANFINGELYGRVTTHPFGMVFPNGGDLPRHPSQLYEAFSEGLLLLLLLNGLAWFRPQIQKKYGFLFGLFLIGYGVVRFLIEFVREPDVQLGLYGDLISQGQILCLPMLLIGGVLVWRAERNNSEV